MLRCLFSDNDYFSCIYCDVDDFVTQQFNKALKKSEKGKIYPYLCSVNV